MTRDALKGQDGEKGAHLRVIARPALRDLENVQVRVEVKVGRGGCGAVVGTGADAGEDAVVGGRGVAGERLAGRPAVQVEGGARVVVDRVRVCWRRAGLHHELTLPVRHRPRPVFPRQVRARRRPALGWSEKLRLDAERRPVARWSRVRNTVVAPFLRRRAVQVQLERASSKPGDSAVPRSSQLDANVSPIV